MVGAEPQRIARLVFNTCTVQRSAGNFAAVGNGFDKVFVEYRAAPELVGIYKAAAFDAIQLFAHVVVFIAESIGAQHRCFNFIGIVTGNFSQCIDKQALAVAPFAQQAEYLLLRNITGENRIPRRFLQIVVQIHIFVAAIYHKLNPFRAVRQIGQLLAPLSRLVCFIRFKRSAGCFGEMMLRFVIEHTVKCVVLVGTQIQCTVLCMKPVNIAVKYIRRDGCFDSGHVETVLNTGIIACLVTLFI